MHSGTKAETVPALGAEGQKSPTQWHRGGPGNSHFWLPGLHHELHDGHQPTNDKAASGSQLPDYLYIRTGEGMVARTYVGEFVSELVSSPCKKIVPSLSRLAASKVRFNLEDAYAARPKVLHR
jgi:hypothetical protein